MLDIGFIFYQYQYTGIVYLFISDTKYQPYRYVQVSTDRLVLLQGTTQFHDIIKRVWHTSTSLGSAQKDQSQTFNALI